MTDKEKELAALMRVGAEACEALMQHNTLLGAIRSVREVALGHTVDAATKSALAKAHEDALDDAISAVLMWRTARAEIRRASAAVEREGCKHRAAKRFHENWRCDDCGWVLKDGGKGWEAP